QTDLAARVGGAYLPLGLAHHVVQVDGVGELDARFAGGVGVLGDLPEQRVRVGGGVVVHQRLARRLVHERVGDQHADVEGADVSLAALTLQVLGGDEVLAVRVVDAQGGHAGTPTGAAVPDDAQRRSEQVPEGGHGTG